MLAPTLTSEKLLHTLALNGWEGGGVNLTPPPPPWFFQKCIFVREGEALFFCDF